MGEGSAARWIASGLAGAVEGASCRWRRWLYVYTAAVVRDGGGGALFTVCMVCFMLVVICAPGAKSAIYDCLIVKKVVDATLCEGLSIL